MISIINNIISSNGYQLVDIELTDKRQNVFLFSPISNSQKEEYLAE